MLAGQEELGHGVLDFEYIVLDVNRYEKQALLDKQNFMSSVLLLDQKSSVSELLTRLEQLADLITSWDEPKVRMFSTWMKNIAIRGLTADKQDEVNNLLDQMKPKEAKRMIYNLERTLKNAFKDAKKEGKLEGKLEVAQHMLHEGFDLEDILKVTKLTRDDVEDLNI
jgi:predicted transposase/invertase (TIGR01784 family)